MDFNDPKKFDDPQVFIDPKAISIGSIDLDNPKVFGDTFIFDGLVSMTVVQGTINCAIVYYLNMVCM